MLAGLCRLYTWPARRPRLALAVALLLAAAAYPAWEAIGLLRYRHAYAEAQRALAAYDFPEARRQLAECLRLRPDDLPARLLDAQAARRNGDLDAADEAIRRAGRVAETPLAEVRLQKAMLDAQSGAVGEVVGPLMELLEIRHPASEQILEALAMGCVRVYRLERASFWTHLLAERAPRNPIGRLIRAQTAETLGNRDKALGLLRELVADFPNHAQVRAALADSLFRTGAYAEAAEHYERLHGERPGDLAPLLGLARCRARQGPPDEARPLMELLEKRHADSSEALLECGRFALGEGRTADAERLLRQAVALAPNDHEIHLQLAMCLYRLDRVDESRQHADRARQIEADLIALEKAVGAVIKAPEDPAPRLEAGRICLRNGQTAEGLRWLNGVLEIIPDHKPTHAALADYYAAQGDGDRAAYHRQRAANSGRMTEAQRSR